MKKSINIVIEISGQVHLRKITLKWLTKYKTIFDNTNHQVHASVILRNIMMSVLIFIMITGVTIINLVNKILTGKY